MGTLERQLAPGQSFNKAIALLSAQAIVKFNGPMAGLGCQHLLDSQWQSPLDAASGLKQLNLFSK